MSDFAKGNVLVACGAAVQSGVLSSFHRRQINKGRRFIKVLNRRATESDTRAKNWQGREGLAL